MNKKEFLKRLEEDKLFDNMDEHMDYRLPVLQYYLDNLIDYKIVTQNGPINLKGVQIKRRSDDFLLVNQAFNSLKQRIKQFK